MYKLVNLIDFTKQDLPVSKVKIMKKKEDKMKKAVIAVPMGDPAGIGPEIVVKAVPKRKSRTLQGSGYRRRKDFGKGGGNL